jgi:hypothetical protein
MAGITLDTGVLIALERRALAILEKWALTEATLTVPAVVIAEWWLNRQWDAAHWLDGVAVEPVDNRSPASQRSARRAAPRPRAHHRRDRDGFGGTARDIVYTSDFDDMTRLATRFPGLRVLSV